MNLTTKGSLFFLTFVITSILNVISIKFYTDSLSIEQYGTFSYLQGVIFIAAAFSCRWVSQSIFRFKHQEITNGRESYFAGSLIIIIIVNTIIISFTLYLLSVWLKISYIYDYYIQLILIIFSFTVIEILNSWLQSSSQVKAYALGEIARALFRLTLPLFFLSLFGKTITTFLNGYVIANFTILILQLTLLKPEVKFDYLKLIDSGKIIFKYGFPISIWFLCTQLTTYGDRFLLEKYWTLNEVALYSGNFQIYSFAAQAFSLPFINTFHPILLKYNVSNKEDLLQFEYLLNKVSDYYLIVSFLLGLALVIYNDLITSILLSEKYHLSFFTIYCIVFGTIFWNLGSYGNKPFEVRKQTLGMLKGVFVSVAIFFVIGYFLIENFSYEGAALAKFISLLSYPAILYYSNNNINRKYLFKIKWEIKIKRIMIVILVPILIISLLYFLKLAFNLNKYQDLSLRTMTFLISSMLIVKLMVSKSDLFIAKKRIKAIPYGIFK